MRIPFHSAVALVLLASAALPVIAESPSPAPADSSVDEDEVVRCETEGVTGSHVKKRKICATNRQRREERERTSEALDDIRTQGTVQRANGG